LRRHLRYQSREPEARFRHHRQQSERVQGLSRVARRQDVEAVFVTVPLFVHYPITRDALMAASTCSAKSAWSSNRRSSRPARPLRRASQADPADGLQRRYSYFYQTVKQMVDKGILGNVHHIHAQWHRNMINKPSSLWTMKPGGEKNIANWRVFRSMSGGLTAELTSTRWTSPIGCSAPSPTSSWAWQPGYPVGWPRRLRQHPADLPVPNGRKMTYS